MSSRATGGRGPCGHGATHISLPTRGLYFPFDSNATIRNNALFNDVRPLNSPPLRWYFKLMMHAEPLERVMRQPTDTPFGQMVFYMAWRLNTPDNEFVSGAHDHHTLREHERERQQE